MLYITHDLPILFRVATKGFLSDSFLVRFSYPESTISSYFRMTWRFDASFSTSLGDLSNPDIESNLEMTSPNGILSSFIFNDRESMVPAL